MRYYSRTALHFRRCASANIGISRENINGLEEMTGPAADLQSSLAQMELFRGLPSAALIEIAERGRIRRIAKNTMIFVRGATAKHCHALIKGHVRISQSDPDGAQLVVRFIGPGQMFGTVALFTDRTYPAEAVAVLESVEITWTEPVLLDLIARYPAIALNLVEVIGGRLREVQDRLRELATHRVERRIAHTLLRLAAQSDQTPESEATIGFPVRGKDIAEMCGTTLHTVSRVLTSWQRRKLITTQRQRLRIRDSSALRRIAEDAPDEAAQ